MLETIYAVKNNRKAKGVLDDHDPRLVPLKKWVRGLARKSKGRPAPPEPRIGPATVPR